MAKQIINNKKDNSCTKRGKIIVLSASSGAGKTTLMHAVCDYFKGKHPLSRVITYTTRVPRHGEVDGVDYHFVSQAQFEHKIQEGFFIEWSCAYGAYYGSPYSILSVCHLGQSLLVVLDRRGVEQLLAVCPDVVVPIWIFTGHENLELRLQSRGSETFESYNARLSLANYERDQEVQNPIFSHHVQNDDFGQALSHLIEIITQELEIIK